jgi:hypothetical protein
VGVSHEASSITIRLSPIFMIIVRIFWVTLSDHRRLLLGVAVGIFAFDCEQFIIMFLQWAVRAGICEKNGLIIINVWFPEIGIWRRVNCLGKQGERRPLRDCPRESEEGHKHRSTTGSAR